MIWYRNQWRADPWAHILGNIARLHHAPNLTPWLEREEIEQRIRSRMRDWRKRGIPDRITRGACIGNAISHGMARVAAERYTDWRMKL